MLLLPCRFLCVRHVKIEKKKKKVYSFKTPQKKNNITTISVIVFFCVFVICYLLITRSLIKKVKREKKSNIKNKKIKHRER